MMHEPVLIGTPAPAAWGEAALMGLVVSLLANTDRRRLSIAALDAWLRVPIRLGQIALHFGERTTPLGYATWAYVSAPGAARLGAGLHPPLELEDWNEGSLPWIVDIVAPHGNARLLLQGVGDHLRAKGHSEIAYSRRRSGLPGKLALRARTRS